MTMIFGNVVYLYISVTFAQILKSCTPFFTLLFAWMLRINNTPWNKIAAVGVIIAGSVVSCRGEISFTWAGVFFQIAAEACEALRLSFMQILLQRENLSAFENLYFICPWACVFQLMLSVAYEGNVLKDVKLEHVKWLLGSAALGLALNFISGVVVKQTSALTLKVLAIVRNSLFVFLLSLVGFEIVTPTASVGYLISLTGFAYYSLAEEVAKARGRDGYALANPADQSQLRGPEALRDAAIKGAFQVDEDSQSTDSDRSV